jgi:tetratricopeptide (TPR) repeat protein
MSEMLANHYFLIRNFSSAKSIYENILEKNLNNKAIKKKLIICYIITGEIDKALRLFTSLIQEDIDYIINTNPSSEDCPCPELISKVENEDKFLSKKADKLAALGMLWLYCSLEKSLEYFKEAEIMYPNDKRFKEINLILINKLKSKGIKIVN